MSVFTSFVLNQMWSGVCRKVRAEKPYVIGITGSVGKTSAKEALALILQGSGRPVVKTSGNMGTDVGMPLSLLGFNEVPATSLGWLNVLFSAWFPPILASKQRPYYVLEYAADKPGDISFLATKIPPQVGVITRIAPAHLQAYPSFDDLITEKFSLLAGMGEGGYAVLNADDPNEKKHVVPEDVTWYGITESAPRKPGVWAHSVQWGDQGLKMSISFVVSRTFDTIGRSQSNRLEVQTRVIGAHQIYPLLAAAAVGMREGVGFEHIKKALEEYEVPNGRGKLLPGIKDTTIIDDTYNASPEAVKAGLETLRQVAKDRRKVAILGTMNELGDQAEKLHVDIARFAAPLVDSLIFVGLYAEQQAAAAIKAGLSAMNVIAFAQTSTLAPKIEQLILTGDVIFLKGSQNGVRLEKVVERLMANPAQAKEVLVRQESFWKDRPL